MCGFLSQATVHVVENDGSTVGCELLRNLKPDADARPGDDGGFVVKCFFQNGFRLMVGKAKVWRGDLGRFSTFVVMKSKYTSLELVLTLYFSVNSIFFKL